MNNLRAMVILDIDGERTYGTGFELDRRVIEDSAAPIQEIRHRCRQVAGQLERTIIAELGLEP